MHRHQPIITVVAIAALMGACGGQATAASPNMVRMGYSAIVTHSPAIIGVSEGFFAEELGDTGLATSTFNSGTEAVEAIFSGALDITFIGPNPAINAFAKSGGEAIRIISGTTSGGAALVVQPEITDPSQLGGTTLATPSLGNTQDVALRTWLAEQGLETNLEGGGAVRVLPQLNAQILETFVAGDIQGAWVPEPWAARLILEGGGRVLVDERDLWPGGEFVTTHLIVSTSFLENHPDTVRQILRGLVKAQDFIESNREAAMGLVNGHIGEVTGSEMRADVIASAFGNLTFTLDPVAASLVTSAENAVSVGLLDPIELDGIYDLTLLNEILAASGKPPVVARR